MALFHLTDMHGLTYTFTGVDDEVRRMHADAQAVAASPGVLFLASEWFDGGEEFWMPGHDILWTEYVLDE